MHIGHLLFQTQGRISRRVWWLSQLVLLAISLLTTYLWQNYGFHDAVYGFISALLMFWIRININIKRVHDHGKSGWWILVYEIPVVGWAWGLVELGLMKGHPGENAHGAPAS